MKQARKSSVYSPIPTISPRRLKLLSANEQLLAFLKKRRIFS